MKFESVIEKLLLKISNSMFAIIRRKRTACFPIESKLYKQYNKKDASKNKNGRNKETNQLYVHYKVPA